jgi:hemerythrin superfamily protein
MKATALLREDHEKVSTLLDQLKSGNTGSKTRGEVTSEVVTDLTVHAAIEEQIVYPIARDYLPDMEGDVLDDLEEHHVIKVLVSELADLDPADDRFVPKVTVLAEIVSHHVEEEESGLFPALEERFGSDELDELGENLEQAKTMAPTRPHPHGPDEPPANLGNLALAVLDRLRDRVGI